MYGNEGNNVPVNEGDEIKVNIEAVGEKGDGIAKKDGFVLFVPGTKQGDNVKVRVTKVLRKVGFAEVVGKADKPAEGGGKEEEPSYAAPEPEESPEDTEDFGEEPSEESAEEVPQPPEEEKEYEGESEAGQAEEEKEDSEEKE
ncbi:MAG: TRAM domain-containing protein [Candidatus Woesearchaeota archaeon]